MAKRSHHLMKALSQVTIGEIVGQARPNEQRSEPPVAVIWPCSPHSRSSRLAVKQLRLCQCCKGCRDRSFMHMHYLLLVSVETNPSEQIQDTHTTEQQKPREAECGKMLLTNERSRIGNRGTGRVCAFAGSLLASNWSEIFSGISVFGNPRYGFQDANHIPCNKFTFQCQICSEILNMGK